VKNTKIDNSVVAFIEEFKIKNESIKKIYLKHSVLGGSYGYSKTN
jgi:hypothetical protein